jgi:hypothetical protein
MRNAVEFSMNKCYLERTGVIILGLSFNSKVILFFFFWKQSFCVTQTSLVKCSVVVWYGPGIRCTTSKWALLDRFSQRCPTYSS